MKHPVDAVEMRPDGRKVGDVGLDELEVRRMRMRRQIFRPSDREIVDDNDIMAIVKQAIDEMTSDKTGAAGNDAFHDRNIHREAAAERASPNQDFVRADYQPLGDYASVTKLFG